MGGRILIADDTSFIRMFQREALGAGGYQVVGEAANGREKAGARDFVVKPFKPERLASAVARILQE